MPLIQRPRKRSARASLMVGIGSALYFGVLLLALYVMDRQVYSAEKLEIIRDNFIEIFHLPDNLNEEARSALFANDEKSKIREREKLRSSLEDIVQGPTSLYHMSLLDEQGHIVIDVENTTKPLAMNTWRNNLFIREFSGRTSQNVSAGKSRQDTSGTMVGHLTGTYTSPVGVEGIWNLTRRYRVYAAVLIVCWILTWALLYYYLLLPVRNVTLHLDLSRRGSPSLIPAAYGALEKGYNELAASALLQMMEEKLYVAAGPGENGGVTRRGEAILNALDLAGSGLGASYFRVVLLGDADATDEPGETYEWSRFHDAHRVERQLPEVTCPVVADETQVSQYADGTGFTYNAPLADGCIQVDCLYNNVASKEQHEHLVRACDVLKAGFVTFQAYQDQLFRERSEANISLSRNMGHDLTNIIATSKLELMGIKRVLEMAAPGTALTEPRASILADSVRGLLESTKLMQEMVNIYRSFSYVKRPAYERRPIEALVEEFLVTFEPALSSQVTIMRNFTADLPSPIVEPRLLKLALFNVLQNALDALKRNSEAREDAGVVTVAVTHAVESGIYEIAVSDNGPGIRGEDGELLAPADAQRIFDYGYSTKGESGEGLGLNWVQTIMSDFHDGGVRAENRAEGGALITLWLRSMERKEARVGERSTGGMAS